jgi:hypothetical protein
MKLWNKEEQFKALKEVKALRIIKNQIGKDIITEEKLVCNQEHCLGRKIKEGDWARTADEEPLFRANAFSMSKIAHLASYLILLNQDK